MNLEVVLANPQTDVSPTPHSSHIIAFEGGPWEQGPSKWLRKWIQTNLCTISR